MLIRARLLVLFGVMALLSACSKDVTLSLSDGDKVSLEQYQGQHLLVNYWAIWCKPCVAEIPELNELNEHAKVSVLGFNFEGVSGAELEAQAKQLNIHFPLLALDPSASFEQQPPSALPATMVISPRGEFVRWLYGAQTKSGLLKELGI